MLKKLHFKSLLLIAVMLLGGASTVWAAEDDEHEFSSTYSKQLNNNAAIDDYTLTDQGYPVKKIVLNYRYNKSIENAVSVEAFIGESSLGSQNIQANTTADMEFTCSPALSGAIKLKFTNNAGSGTGKGTFYINKVTLVEGATSGLGTVSTPSFTPAGGTFVGTQNVTINCATDGATIYYTTNGSTPTASSNVYSSAIEVSSNTTIKAFAVKDGMTDSSVGSATYTILDEVPGLNVDFEADDLDCYTDWEFTNISLKSTNSDVTAHSGSYYGNTGGKASATIQTKNKVAAPGLLKFYVSKESNNTTASSWTVAVSSAGSEWTNVGDAASAASMDKGEWVEVTRNLSSYSNVYVRISYGSSTAVRAIDDISILPATKVEGITLDKTAAEVSPTKTIKLTPIFTPADASNQNVTWTSDAPTVASVAAGVVTGVAEGTANITVTTEDGGFTATCAVTVRVIHPSSITLDKANATIEVGDEYQLTATVLPDDADDMSVSWDSSNPEVATVSSTGLVTAVKKGSATITATTNDGDLTASCVVTVKNPATPTLVYDFTNAGWNFPEDYVKAEATYTNGLSVKFGESSNGHKVMKSSGDITGVIFGEQDATLSLSAFPFNVSRIKVYGTNNASGKVTFNVFVGDEAASTEVTSAKVTHTFDIAEDKQTSGNIFTIKVTNDNNCQISRIEVFGYDNVPVGATGFATYCSRNALDFSDVTDLTAYTASLAGDVVTFNEITTDIPNETGVLLKGAAGTYKVPVVDGSTTDVSRNKLVGTYSGTTIDGTSGNYYVLKQNAEGVGFYKVTNKAYNVRANSAYLDVDKGSAKGFIPVDGTTAIELVDTANEVAAPVYNLQGQRVSNGYKGVVIVNGKKIMMK